MSDDPLYVPHVTDECLAGMISSPSRYAAWLLRAALVELRDRRELDAVLNHPEFKP